MTETLEVTQGQGVALPETPAAVEQSPTVETPIETPVADKPRDETGKFTKKPPTIAEAVKKAAEQLEKEPSLNNKEVPNSSEKPLETPPAVDETKTPEHWPADAKAAYDALPAEAKKPYLEAVKKLEGAYTKRNQEQAARIKYGEVIEQRAKGAAPEEVAGFIDYYTKIEQGFKQNPAKVIEFLAQQAGIDLKKQYGGQPVETDNEFIDPYEQQIKSITQKVDEKLSAYEQMLQNQAIAKAQAEIDAELAKTDASGQPLYPHFQKLEPVMIKLQAAGFGQTFGELYQKALNLDPELSQQFAQEKEAKLKADMEAARKAAVEKAKGAATHLNGSAPAKISTRAKTPAEAVAMAMRQISTQ